VSGDTEERLQRLERLARLMGDKIAAQQELIPELRRELADVRNLAGIAIERAR
jgi:hypothetical protein